ncbi:poly [ADP-ribose] polymerase-like isoform X2 [Neocloeon triangulifer]|uniref:poly [ADP-ribose] polymerase-like isoform X2 n=1 Tax=Neocloeon triangulifer TaxID=2078957 RepID=UPI00286F2C99|nr:poly [ADP-ribose] polymerase-like isoform X2 [Neocloeon triangulifer]
MDHPYSAEYAKSGRSKCRGCGECIEHGLLRFSISTQLSYWFHKDCFFKRHKPGKTADIAKFSSLKADDKAYIRANIGAQQGDPEISEQTAMLDVSDDEDDNYEDLDSAEEESPKKKPIKAKKGARRLKVKVGQRSKFMVDYSLSNRSTCCSCHEKIEKSVVRVAKMDYTSNKGKALNGIPRWYHVKCFANNRDFFEFWDSAEGLPGFFALKSKDQKELLNSLPEMTLDRAKGAGSWKIKKIEAFCFKKMTEQLAALNMKDYESILKHNNQDVPKQARRNHLLDLVNNAAKNGVPDKCPKCNSDGLIQQDGSDVFECQNMKDEIVCGYKSSDPPRTGLKIPEKLKEEFEILKNYNFDIAEKKQPDQATATCSFSLNADAPEFVPRPKPVVKKGPLSGMEFAVIGVPEAKEKILQLGGRVVTFFDRKTKAVVTNEDSIKKLQANNKRRFYYIEEHLTPVVGIEFLDHVGKGKNLKRLLQEFDMSAQWLYDIDPHRFGFGNYGGYGYGCW